MSRSEILFSVFTPTNDPRYIEEAWASLRRQTLKDWEWVVVPNGPVRPEHLPASLQEDPQVRIVPGPDTEAIGALKRFACEQCRGRLLVELDHDDYLASNALERIAYWYERTGAPFLYSDNVAFHHDDPNRFRTYDPSYGWRAYEAEVDGRRVQANRFFEPTPACLLSIYFAPDHVRVWDRRAYWAVGGHDEALDVCDDYDLVLRTYLAGYDFCHIPEPLYFYRVLPRGRNNYMRRQERIAELQRKLALERGWSVLGEWCRRKQLRRILITWPDFKMEGYDRVDLLHEGFALARSGLPFENDSVGHIYVTDLVQWLPPCELGHEHPGREPEPIRCLGSLMAEAYRVLAQGGWLTIESPAQEARAAGWPTHRPENYLPYLVQGHAQQSPPHGVVFQSAWPDYFPLFRIVESSGFGLSERGVLEEGPWRRLGVDLCAVKGPGLPGRCLIQDNGRPIRLAPNSGR